ncbi:hypothetical protein FNL56_21645 [Tardiphaga sp. vice304]|uniref:phasin family protein n=1 Tax=Tardiphaga sp. vice304 TaxID=2592817 RepID=UPI001164ABAD|nr:phasin family protein [Tardiphaga sp. vice304]QDM28424.1 hypothetical protein FNL56_21645 [Tardiphaga sp. vice304]
MSKRSKSSGLKNSTMLARAKGSMAEAAPKKQTPTETIFVTPVSTTGTVSDPDPLEAVAATQEKIAQEFIAPSVPGAACADAPEPASYGRPSANPTLWDFSAKVLGIAQANAICASNFVKHCSTAKTPQDIIAAASEFYKKQGRLLGQQSNDMFEMLAGPKH